MTQISIPQTQRIADSFSLGVVTSVDKLLEKRKVRQIKLSERNLRTNPLLAAGYAGKLPEWFAHHKNDPSWDSADLAQALQQAGYTHHRIPYLLSVYSLRTTHGAYLLVGISQQARLPIAHIERLLKHELQISSVEQIKTTTQPVGDCAHRRNMHWYIFRAKHLTQLQAVDILKTLENQPISLEIGYGAPLFITVGQANSMHPPLAKIFTDEYWWVEVGGDEVTNRWSVADDFFNQNKQLLLKIVELDAEHKLTRLVLSNDHTICIPQEEQLTSWDCDFPKAGISLRLTGVGHFVLTDYQPPEYKPSKQKLAKILAEPRPPFIENQELSNEVANRLLKPLLQLPISKITEDSGKSFGLELGTLIDQDRHQVRISIDGEWVLKRRGRTLVGSATHSFAFMPLLVKYLQGQRLLSTPTKTRPVLLFSGDLELQLSPKVHWQHLGLATVFNRAEEHHLTFDGTQWRYTGPKHENKIPHHQR